MSRWALPLARLYPPRWRARYGAEFDALLGQAPLSWRDTFDIFAGALRMWIWNGGTDAMHEATTTPRLMNMSCRDIPHGYELESSIEFGREDGSKTLARYFCREIDLGDSYVTLTHTSRGSAPAQTILVCGKKGEVDGDFRTDETEMLVLEADGTVRRTEQTVKTWLKHRIAVDRLREKFRSGLSAEEIFRQIRAVSDHPAWF
jgi:hypothetical protein